MTVPQHISKPRLKFARSLSQKKVRSREALFVVEGWRAVEDACRAGIRASMFIYTPAAKENSQYARIFASALNIAHEAYEVSEHELAAVTETVTSQGVALILPQFAHRVDDVLARVHGDASHIVVALDRISEPGNAGTIIRTADWFGAEMVILSEESVELYNPKVVRSTMGSLFHIPVIECTENQGSASLIGALAACRAAGFTLYGADVNAQKDVRTIRWAQKTLIVIGNEAHGLTPGVSALLDECVTIPKFGKAESLNAASAAAVMLGSMRLR